MNEVAAPPAPKQENALLNIAFNILIPVLILNKLGKHIGPLPALGLALIFPVGYGIYDLIERKKINAFSILGLLNVLLTGGLAVIGLKGFWFAVKEAAFPALIGFFVLGSAFTKKPFIQSLFLNPSLMKTEVLQERLEANNKVQAFHDHMKKATIWLSLSFALSAALNFILARRIFINIDETLSAEQQSLVLNDQIADMTSWSFLVIMVPSVIFLMAIFWYMMKGVKNLSGMNTEDLMRENNG